MGVLSVEDIEKYVRMSKDVYVSTVDSDGYPITRVMFNLHNPDMFPKQSAYLNTLDDRCIYLGTNTASNKVSHVVRNSRMSLYFHTHGSWDGMLVAGDGELVEDMSIKTGLWQSGWEMYYAGGVESPDYAVIRVRPAFAEFYHDLSKDVLRLR